MHTSLPGDSDWILVLVGAKFVHCRAAFPVACVSMSIAETPLSSPVLHHSKSVNAVIKLVTHARK